MSVILKASKHSMIHSDILIVSFYWRVLQSWLCTRLIVHEHRKFPHKQSEQQIRRIIHSCNENEHPANESQEKWLYFLLYSIYIYYYHHHHRHYPTNPTPILIEVQAVQSVWDDKMKKTTITSELNRLRLKISFPSICKCLRFFCDWI